MTKAIELKPKNARLHSVRGDCYRKNKNYDKAIEDYTKAIELKPKNAEFYSSRAVCYWVNNHNREVEEDYTKAIELEPENAVFYLKRACFYKYEETYYKAIKDYTKAIELQPEKAEFYSKRGKCYSEMENSDNALKDYDKTIELAPERADAYSGRGRCYFEMKNYDEALKNCDKAVELDPKCAEAYENRGDIYNEINDYKKAEADYKQAYKLAPNEKICRKLMELYKITERFTAAIDMAWELMEYGQSYYNEINEIVDYAQEVIAIKEQEKAQAKIEHEQKIAQARVDERNKVIQDLSHSIKNLISTIIDPLNNLKKEKEVKPAIIDDALKGANLIREIVNAMTLSFKGSIEDFYYDARNIDKDRTDLQSALVESLISSVGNMFDGKYFPDFQTEYFASEDIIEKAESEWTRISQSKNLHEITAFLRKYFFDCDFSFDNAAKYAMGNEKGAAIKLLILFQELIQNAVKYSAFVSRENRRLRIVFNDTPEQIIVRIENRYNDRINVSTSGIGHVIVENFCKLIETEPVVTKENGIYAVEIRFANFWKETDK